MFFLLQGIIHHHKEEQKAASMLNIFVSHKKDFQTLNNHFLFSISFSLINYCKFYPLMLSQLILPKDEKIYTTTVIGTALGDSVVSDTALRDDYPK